MDPRNKQALEQRVVRAAEATLAHQKYVSAIDVLTGMGLLAPTHLKNWRNGRIDFLERVIQGDLKKISLAMRIFRRWATAKGLKPSETQYVRHTRGPKVDLRFSKSGDLGIEKAYRTHYVSPELPERKLQNLEERLSRAPQPVVFQIVRDSRCTECGAELLKGSFLFMEAEQPLCLPCAGRGDLEYLPAGDAALTRRATKHSERSAVVVRFSRSRGRYERQGILVEQAALEKAEQECVLDAAERAQARARGAKLRQQEDRELLARMTAEIRRLFPGCPPGEEGAIAKHTAERGSGRVGRSADGRGLEEDALTAAVAAAVRHNHTNYDELLARGVDRGSARAQVGDRVQAILAKWRRPQTEEYVCERSSRADIGKAGES